MAAITSKILTSIVTLAGKQGYAALSKKFGFYKFLSDLGIARPKDDFGQLYLQTVVLFAAKGRPKELIELILLEDCKKAFWKEMFEGESGAFINLLDCELHVNPIIKEIKHWNEIPFELIADFFEIYDELTGKVLTPVQNKMIKQSEAISDQVKTGFIQMEQKLNMLLETTGKLSVVFFFKWVISWPYPAVCSLVTWCLPYFILSFLVSPRQIASWR